MMSVGASLEWLELHDQVKAGYFWCQKFTGEHITVDYFYGKQDTTAKDLEEGRLDRFDKWELIDREIPFPERLVCYGTGCLGLILR